MSAVTGRPAVMVTMFGDRVVAFHNSVDGVVSMQINEGIAFNAFALASSVVLDISLMAVGGKWIVSYPTGTGFAQKTSSRRGKVGTWA